MSSPPPAPTWLPRAQAAALTVRAETTGKRGAGHHLYVVLLENRRRACRFGLYVGETSRDPDLRFDQHKTGYKASRHVTRHGVMLLPGLTAHLNPLARWEAIDLEEALADAFRRAGVPWVEGGH